MKISPITDGEFRVIRLIRWLSFTPVMFGTAFMTGLMFIPLGRPGKLLAIFLSALAGIAMAPRYRVWATVFAFFYGNYLYATKINYIYHENYSEFFTGYCEAVVKQAKLFSIPTVLTFVAAVLMDRQSQKIERQRIELRNPTNR